MIVTHRIALDLNNRQETLLRQHAGYARYAWNWCLAESKRALDAGEDLSTSVPVSEAGHVVPSG